MKPGADSTVSREGDSMDEGGQVHCDAMPGIYSDDEDLADSADDDIQVTDGGADEFTTTISWSANQKQTLRRDLLVKDIYYFTSLQNCKIA